MGLAGGPGRIGWEVQRGLGGGWGLSRPAPPSCSVWGTRPLRVASTQHRLEDLLCVHVMCWCCWEPGPGGDPGSVLLAVDETFAESPKLLSRRAVLQRMQPFHFNHRTLFPESVRIFGDMLCSSSISW